MDKENKKDTNSKFNFVSMEELEKTVEEFNENNSDNSIELSEVPKTVNVPKFEVTEENIELENDNKASEVVENNIKNKMYFSFEARVITMIILILVMFGGACYLVLDAINHSSKKTVTYDEVADVNYQVCYGENEYYGSTCLDEGMEYVTSLIDKLKVNFKYNVKVSEEINYDLSYHVVAIAKIYDSNNPDKILYDNENVIVEKTRISNTSDTIDINAEAGISYNAVNNFIVDYNKKNSLDSSSSVKVVLYIDDPVESREVASIDVPLATTKFEITKNAIKNENKEVKISNNTWDDYNTVCAIVASLLIISSLILLYKTTRLVLKVTTNRNKYQTKLTQILREYDRIIVIARDGYESNVKKTVIKVEKFEELLAARDTLEKPIIFSKVNDVKSEFIVEDDEKLFKFVLKESDL